jgi:hypothetical protein
MTQLAVYEHAKEALAAAVKFDEVTQLHSAAQKAEAYARIAKDRKLQADAAEIVARAERKLGIMLRAAKDEGLISKGGRPARSNLAEPETGADAEPVFDSSSFGSGPSQPQTFTLAEIGVDKKLSSRAQKAAELDDEGFEGAVKVTREKILEADTPVVRAPKAKPVKQDKPEPVRPLEPRRFHQFVFSVLALSVSSDRVGSRAIQFLARETGILGQGEDNLDFTPEADAAMGAIAAVALKAMEEGEKNTQEGSGTAREASGGQPLPDANGTGDIGGLKQGTQSAPQPLTREEQDASIRLAYEVNAPIAEIERITGLSPNVIKGRARRMGLSSRDRQREIARGQMQAINARRAGDA